MVLHLLALSGGRACGSEAPIPSDGALRVGKAPTLPCLPWLLMIFSLCPSWTIPFLQEGWAHLFKWNKRPLCLLIFSAVVPVCPTCLLWKGNVCTASRARQHLHFKSAESTQCNGPACRSLGSHSSWQCVLKGRVCFSSFFFFGFFFPEGSFHSQQCCIRGACTVAARTSDVQQMIISPSPWLGFHFIF